MFIKKTLLAVLSVVALLLMAGIRPESSVFAHSPSPAPHRLNIASASQAWGNWQNWLLNFAYPAVGQNQDGRLEVFATNTNDPNCWPYSVVEFYQGSINDDDSWSSPVYAGNCAGDTTAAVATDPAGRMEVFAQQMWVGFGGVCSGQHYEIGHIQQAAANQDTWSNWSSLGDPASTCDLFAPFLGVNQDGRLDVFAYGGDNNVWHKWQYQAAPNALWVANWASLGIPTGLTSISSTLALGRMQNGTLVVFVLGGGEIYENWQLTPSDENNWHGWVSFGHPVGVNLLSGDSEPAVVQNADGRLEFFTAGSDGAIWTKWQVAPNSYWSGWMSLGQPSGVNLVGPPVVGEYLNGALDVFVAGNDGAIWHIWQKGLNGSWSNWATLGKPSGQPTTTQLAVGRNQNGNLILFAIDTNGWLNWITEILPSLSPAPLPGGTVGQAYNQPITVYGGTAPYIYALTKGGVPGISLNSDGQFGQLSGTPTSAGTFGLTITVTDADGLSGERTYSLVIAKAYTITVLKSSLNPSVVGQAVTFTTSVISGGGTPPGSVTLKDGSTVLGARALSNGVATFSTSSLAVGTHSITAHYGGSNNFNGSTSSMTTQIVKHITLNLPLILR